MLGILKRTAVALAAVLGAGASEPSFRGSSESKALATSASSLAYDFGVPLSVGQGAPSAATLSVCNYGEASVSVSSWEIANNVPSISGQSGALFPPNEYSISEQSSGDETVHTVTYSTALNIPAGECLDGTYANSGTPAGYLPIQTAPASVSVQVEGQSMTEIDVTDRCQGQDCLYPSAQQNVVWAPNWYAGNYPGFQLPDNNTLSLYSGQILAFFNPTATGEIQSLSPGDPIVAAHMAMWSRRNTDESGTAQRKTYASVGGATYSQPFPALFADPTAVQNFANNLVAMAKQLGLSGVNLDIEANIPPAQFLQGMQTIASTLHSNGLECSLAFLSGTDTLDYYERTVPGFWQQMAAALDWLYPMTYDDWVSGQGGVGFIRPLNDDPKSPYYQWGVSFAEYVQYCQQKGIPLSNTIFGLPAYTYVVSVSSLGETYGLWQPQGPECESQYGGGTCQVDNACLAKAINETGGYCLSSSDSPYTPPSLFYIPAGSAPDGMTYWETAMNGWGYNPESLVVTAGIVDGPAVQAAVKNAIQSGGAGFHTWHAYAVNQLPLNSTLNVPAMVFYAMTNGSIPIPSMSPSPAPASASPTPAHPSASPSSSTSPKPAASASAAASPAAPGSDSSDSSVLLPALGLAASIALTLGGTTAAVFYYCRRRPAQDGVNYQALAGAYGVNP